MNLQEKLVYKMHDTFMEVAVARDAEKQVMTAINRIIEDPMRKRLNPLDRTITSLCNEDVIKQKLNDICHQFADYDPSYSINDLSGISLACAASHADSFRSAIMAVVHTISHTTEVIRKSGMKRFLCSRGGRDRLRALEHRYHTRIKVKEHCSITIQQGNILRCNTDTIVNAANSELNHIGGIARAISSAGKFLYSFYRTRYNTYGFCFLCLGGDEIQAECSEFNKTHGEIKDGDVYASGAGNLKQFMFILHAVGPRWKDGTHNEAKMLTKCIQNCLLQAENRGAKSVAIPAVSTGIFGYPVVEATQVIVDAVKKYNSTFLEEIVLVDESPEAVQGFKSALQDDSNEKSSSAHKEPSTSLYGLPDSGML